MNDAQQWIATAFDKAEADARGDGRRLAALARIAMKNGLLDRAYPVARAARAAAPRDPEVMAMTAAAFAGTVPKWHFDIVADARRNQAYDAAIRRAVSPGCRVLDIGAGTGLLGMMAARAGAGEVICCEKNPAIADVARDIVAANGLADRVRVVARISTGLDLAADLGGPVDVLVSEIVSNDILGQDVLAVMADAVGRRLLRPGGAMIPASAAALAALVDWDEWPGDRLDDATGFDLSPLNRLRRTPVQVKGNSGGVALRSAPALLYDFDFTRGGGWPAPRATATATADGGRCNGLLLWMLLRLDAETTYEVRWAHGPHESWAALFFPFVEAVVHPAGTPVTIAGIHDKASIHIWNATDG